jgi:hypothetical protein
MLPVISPFKHVVLTVCDIGLVLNVSMFLEHFSISGIEIMAIMFQRLVLSSGRKQEGRGNMYSVELSLSLLPEDRDSHSL